MSLRSRKGARNEEVSSESHVDVLATPPTLAAVSCKARLLQWLQFYVKYLEKSIHQDKLLKVLQWTTWLLATLMAPKNEESSRTALPGTATALTTLSNEIGWARFVTRLLEWPTAWEATLSDSWTATHDSSSPLKKWFRKVGKLLAWSMLLYYPTEGISYLQWKVPGMRLFRSSWLERSAESWSTWSCRMWLVYLLAESAQCLLQVHEAQRKRVKDHDEDNHDDDDNDIHTKLQLARNALFLLPCIHWSLPHWDTKPWLRTYQINSLLWLESWVSLYQSMRQASG